MREIKFRGKRKGEPNEWLFGDLNQIDGHVFIFPRKIGSFTNSYDYYEVIPETVGEFTGLEDKWGKEIFEGDIIDYGCNRFKPVEFIGSTFCICKNTAMPTLITLFPIVGNIHDNPELLKTN